MLDNGLRKPAGVRRQEERCYWTDKADGPCRLKHVRPQMTIASVRIYFYPMTQDRELKLTASHWGFSEWFARRLKPIREQLRGPEAKGVDIMNLMLYENPDHAWQRDKWHQRGNTFQFSFVCDLHPLEAHPSIENISKLMTFYAAVADRAPWPQVRSVATALRQPLSEVDRITLLPYLQWPRGEMISEAKAKRIAKSAA